MRGSLSSILRSPIIILSTISGAQAATNNLQMLPPLKKGRPPGDAGRESISTSIAWLIVTADSEQRGEDSGSQGHPSI